ncbi:MAG: methyltransferase domain-containing protein [Anaerolineae bacterium]|nr:methyltransferase domain-containing protein [Anaerolineae bacterium]
MMTSLTAFDSLAADYDRSFTHSTLGQLMRAAVWRRLDANFAPGSRVLELNCGTGEDAVYLARKGIHVLATDVSAAMCDLARKKTTQAQLSHYVSVKPMAIEAIEAIGNWQLATDETLITNNQSTNNQSTNNPMSFDGLLSNFGGLNCIADLDAFARDAATVLRLGARVVLCIMGPWVPWEWLWYLRKGQPRKAFRRLGRDGVAWRDLRIRYPSVRAVRQQFANGFRFLRASAVGALLPPSYAESWGAETPAISSTP